MSCPVCSADTHAYARDKVRSYLQCEACKLVFVPRTELISFQHERERYDHHQNLESDAEYHNYLRTIADEVIPHLEAGETGLDFGSGRTRLMEEILTASGYPTRSYDLFYYPDTDLLQKKWDFILMSEVIEHLRDPFTVMITLSSLLSNGGKIFIKTKFLPEREAFDQWFYKRDITHVQFFSPVSLDALTGLLGLRPHEKIGADLYLIRKN